MWRRRFRFASLLIAVLMTAGCWDARDIEERSIATLVILDKTDTGYAFYVEYAVISASSSSGSGEGKNSYRFSVGEGETLAIARDVLETKSINPIYLGAVSAVVLTENMARFGIEEYMYRLREINDYRKVVDIFVTSETPEAVMAIGRGETSVGKIVESILKNLIKNDQICDIAHLAKVLEHMANTNNCFLLPAVSIVNEEIIVSGFSVFSDARCIGSIPWAETRGINFINMEHVQKYYTVPYGQETTTFALRLKNKKIVPSYEDGTVSFLIELNLRAQIAYASDAIKLYDADDEALRQQLQTMIAEEMLFAIETSQRCSAAITCT